MEPEQRKNVRFLADDSAIIALRNRFTKIGKLKDISIGGLSFEHIYDEDMSQEPFGKDIFIGILLFNHNLASAFSVPSVVNISLPGEGCKYPAPLRKRTFLDPHDK